MAEQREHIGCVEDADSTFCDSGDCWCATPPGVAPTSDTINEAIREMKPVRTSLAEKVAQENMSEFERDYPWGGNHPVAPAPVATPEQEQPGECSAEDDDSRTGLIAKVAGLRERVKSLERFIAESNYIAAKEKENGSGGKQEEGNMAAQAPVATAETAQGGESREEFERDRFGTAGPFTPLPKLPQFVGTVSSGAIREQSWRAEAAEAKPPTGTPEPLREALASMLALFDDEGYFHEEYQDQASVALEKAHAALAAAPQASPPDYAAFVALAEQWDWAVSALRKVNNEDCAQRAADFSARAVELRATIAQQRKGQP